jgi:uncharacterized membrane protein YphA (DoxX/SURF4 family)
VTRITFGAIWAVDAALKWQAAFRANFGRVVAGFGGPYMPGTSTDVGAAIIYSLVFLALLLVDAGRFSVDRWIVRRVPAWRHVSD